MFATVPRLGPLLCRAAQCRRVASVIAGHLFNVTTGATGVAKKKLLGSELPKGWSTAAIVFSATCIVGSSPALAAIDLSAGATVGVEHDSNPLELSDAQAQDFKARGFIARQDDTVKRLTGTVGAVSGSVNEPTHIQLQGKYSKVDNVYFDTLDHTEYNLGGNLDWKPSRVFDISLQGSQNRAPVGLNDIGGQRVVQQTSTLAEGALRLRPMPDWQISLTPRWYRNELPLPGAGNFALRESSGTLGLGYLGAGPLVPGVFVTDSTGTYSGIVNATRYKQRSYGVSLNYKVTDFSSFSLFAGHTERTTHLIEPTTNAQALLLEGTRPAYTGSLAYQRQLSVKTRVTLSIFRDFQQYDVGVNTRLANGFNGELTWAPTARLSMTVNAQLVKSTIEGLEAAGSTDEREDLERSVSVGVKYLATRFISLHPYLTRRVHNSTARSAVFDKTVAGLELTVSID